MLSVSPFSLTQCGVLRGCSAGAGHTRMGTFNAIVSHSSILSRNFISYTVFYCVYVLYKIGETLIKLSYLILLLNSFYESYVLCI